MADPNPGGVIIIHGLNDPALQTETDKATMTSLMGYCSMPNTASTATKALYAAINTMLGNIT